MSAQNSSVARQRGVTGVETRRVLEALRKPGRVADLVTELSLTVEVAWANVKHLHERGLLERIKRGVYRINALGEDALKPLRTEPARLVQTGAPRPPAGKGWTPERTRWLEKYYGRLGPRRCGELLEIGGEAVYVKARKLHLRFGEVDGYTLLSDVADLLVRDYVMLYARADRARVLTFPGTVAEQERRSKALVPDWWVDQIADEAQPPTPEDVALADLRAELGLSKTQAARVAGRRAYLRTPVTGGQAQLYTDRETAEVIRAKYREKAKRPAVTVVGRAGILAAIEAAGAEGASERELYEALPCSRTAVRVHVRALFLAGTLERCRLGDTLDPFVYRLALHQGQPTPAQRKVVIPGRPRKVRLEEAAD